MTKSIAIDGPAGAGKSTIAKSVSKKLGLLYLDTGAMYRAIGFWFLRNNKDPKDQATVEADLDKIEVTVRYENNEQIVLLNGENVNGLIRTQEVGKAASDVSVYKLVRQKMVKAQQEIAERIPLIMDGRDIGTVVLPNALLKIFLTAPVEIRARRRYLEYREKGIEKDLDTLEQEIKERDYQDMHRENSPLTQAEDAILVDTGDMNIQEVVDTIIDLAIKKGFVNAD